MSDREKLIELMVEARGICLASDCTKCDYNANTAMCDYTLAIDHLIANGVTMQKWIPVSERLPTEEDADEYEAVYAISKGSYPKQWHWTKVAEIPDHFTHWMSLPPEPPKERE